jgi:hypothetical protein
MLPPVADRGTHHEWLLRMHSSSQPLPFHRPHQISTVCDRCQTHPAGTHTRGSCDSGAELLWDDRAMYMWFSTECSAGCVACGSPACTDINLLIAFAGAEPATCMMGVSITCSIVCKLAQ